MRRLLNAMAVASLVLLLAFTPGARADLVKPAEALEVLPRFQPISGVNPKVTDDEVALFADVQGGRFTSWSFEEAALLASGVTDEARRKSYLDQIDRLAEEAEKATDAAKNPCEKGEALLKWLHAHPMAKGYQSHQSSLAVVLETGKFNCLSSAVLYYVLARRLGLDVSGMEQPDHVFVVLHDGIRHMNVQTTSAAGFRAQGKDGGTGRPVGEVELVALLYYNRGVELSKAKRYHEALLVDFCALSLDPKLDSSRQNILAALTKWSKERADAGEFETALGVLDEGRGLAPREEHFANNLCYLVREWARNTYRREGEEAAREVLRAQRKRFGDVAGMQAVVVGHVSWVAKQQEDAGRWEEALAAIERHADLLDDSKEVRELSLSVYDAWADSYLKQKDWEGALAVYDRALERFPKDGHLTNNAVATWNSWAMVFVDKKDWDGAIAVYEKGLAKFLDNHVLKNNLEYCREQKKKAA
jgi:tetratricopeptide (TPR) repeat protein